MSEEPLKWLKMKPAVSKKSRLFRCDREMRNNNTFEVPLTCIFFDVNKQANSKNGVLIIFQDKICFECYNFTGCKLSTTYEIPFSDITKIGFMNSKSLLSISVTDEFYKATFPKSFPTEYIFMNTIWFCLELKSHDKYQSIKDRIKSVAKETTVCDLDERVYLKFRSLVKESEHIDKIMDYARVDGGGCLSKSGNDLLSINNYRSVNLKQSKIKLKRKKEDFNIKPASKRSRKHKKCVYHSIEITGSDIECLEPQTYINDNIINFYLTYIYNEILNDNQRRRSHFFNCFFNTKLIGMKSPPSYDTPAKRHERVAKWTKNIDIFDKDFLIIPVIESQHWFLIIVCFPWMAGMIDYEKLLGKNSSSSSIPVNTTEFASVYRQEKVEAIKSELNINPMPCILILDSLTLQRGPNKVNIIRDYLKFEWDSKRSKTDGSLIFDKTTVRGYRPKIPQQQNLSDCGVYLLHYVEMFFKDPIKDFTFDFFNRLLSDWFDQTDVDKKRQDIKSIIAKISSSDPSDLEF